MKLILKYLSKFKMGSILAPLFKLLEALIDLAIPYLIGLLIDNGIYKNDKHYILLMFLIMISCAFVGLLFSIIGQYFSAKTATLVSSTMRKDLFKHIEKLNFESIDNIGTVGLINRLTNDINQVQNGVNLLLRLILRSPFVVFGSVILATILAPKVSYIFWIVIGILFIFTFIIMLSSIPIINKQQAKLDDLLQHSKDNLTGTRVIRTFGIENDEIDNFNKENNNLLNIQKKSTIVSSFLNPVTYLIINLCIVLLIYLGALKVNDGILSSGNVISLYNYMGQILIELIKFTNLVILINKMIVSSNRINEILKIKITDNIVIDNNIYNNYIKFDNVSFAYNKGNVLHNINFEINKGDFLGIIGPTGSGKTTLINLLLHSYNISDGKIIFNGKNISNYKPSDVYKRISVTNQKIILFKGTIRDNLLISNPNATDEELIAALRDAQCGDFILNKDNPLDLKVGYKGRNFSGGQRQRLAMARCIASKKEVLIFDDSTSALDFLTDSNFRTSLKNLSFKPTIIIISQRASTMLNTDKILVLDGGKQLGFDNNVNLLKDCSMYQSIYYTQFSKEDNK